MNPLDTETPPLRRSQSTAAGRATRQIFRSLNGLVEPLVRSGIGSPVAGLGLVVVETTGRRTGRPRRVPLVGWRSGSSVTVSTVRTNSDWIHNLEADRDANVWSAGSKRAATATVRRLPTCTWVHLRTANEGVGNLAS